jgi:hypothetical protein
MGTRTARVLCLVLASAVVLAPMGVLAADRAPVPSSVTVSTSMNTLTNVTDAAGLWQFEGGTISLDGQVVANYATSRRVVIGGTISQNTAMLTMTIMVIGSDPPECLTLQGTHSYNSGVYIGSVSAASAAFAYLRGATFVGQAGVGSLTLTF